MILTIQGGEYVINIRYYDAWTSRARAARKQPHGILMSFVVQSSDSIYYYMF